MSQTLVSIYSYYSIGVKFFLGLSYKVGQQLHYGRIECVNSSTTT